MKVGDEVTFAGLKATVARIEGSKVTYHLGTDRIEVTVDLKDAIEPKPKTDA